jgi:hypothetical protein
VSSVPILDEQVRSLLTAEACEAVEARRAHLGDHARCTWCWRPLDDDAPSSVVVFDPHAGHQHERREAVVGLTHAGCRDSGVVGLDGDRLERSLQTPRAHLALRDRAPRAVLALELVGDLLVLRADGSVTELPTSGMAASGFRVPERLDELDERVPAVAGWWLELDALELAVEGSVGGGRRNTYLAARLPQPLPAAAASWSAAAHADGAVVVVGTTRPLLGASDEHWTTLVELGSLPPPRTLHLASVPVRSGPGEGLRRNDRCACGSGAKYKACCGR